eukprot:CAMPEP_0167749376 /NCGR_PEP_ID=MMETSP0110_2-20121227/5371_1 /TAXON_ID=629695 /ORGANISM="Gymnochlora sp., Strain CCMP2014" /LENGTH=230 /DNA_ID=CAMNT_0007634519 /DNA_START=157 /DNA_END=849 /DNA_ORIENTATION=+
MMPKLLRRSLRIVPRKTLFRLNPHRSFSVKDTADEKAVTSQQTTTDLDTGFEQRPGAFGMPAPKDEIDEEIEKQLAERPPETEFEKAVHATKTGFNYAIVLGGLTMIAGISGTLYYYFFSGTGPQKIFDESLPLVKMDPRVASIIGTPITGLAYHRVGTAVVRSLGQQEYETKDGIRCFRVRYIARGPRGLADIDAEMTVSKEGKRELSRVAARLPGGERHVILDTGKLF